MLYKNKTVACKIYVGSFWLFSLQPRPCSQWLPVFLRPSVFQNEIILGEKALKHFGSDENLQKTVTTYLSELAAEEYDVRIEKLVKQNDND